MTKILNSTEEEIASVSISDRAKESVYDASVMVYEQHLFEGFE